MSSANAMVSPLFYYQLALLGRVPLACSSFPPSENRVKCPHFSTCMRGFCDGLQSLFLPVGTDRSCVAVPHAPLDVAKRPRHVPANTRAHTPSAKAQACAPTLCGPHHKASLRRLCACQRPPSRGILPPATAPRVHTGAPPPGGHLHAFLPEPRLTSQEQTPENLR